MAEKKTNFITKEEVVEEIKTAQNKAVRYLVRFDDLTIREKIDFGYQRRRGRELAKKLKTNQQR
ncbi:MAG: hypothetical protein LBD94_00205 [Rickettsiales bacterium]|jgi:hypothetical protein|nr:hypothetical protein [Rickettsiales bacterium]